MTRATKKTTSPPPADGEEEGHTGTITTRQMRQLHALLRDHGITTDKGIHDYIRSALTEAGEEPVESRSDLSATAAARMIADLEAAEVTRAPTTPARLAELRAPFTPEEIGKLPRSTCRNCSDKDRSPCDRHTWIANCPECGGYHTSGTIHLDFVGHADVTARLLSVDPGWTWEPAMRDPNGHPSIGASIDRDGNLWINLTVLGVTRPGVGDGKNAKEKIGDALRNAAMRFGVALDLWAKGDRDWARAEKDGTDRHPDEHPAPAPQADPPPPPYHGPTTAELLVMVDDHARALGVTYEKATEKWRERNGGLTLDALDSLPPQQVAELERWLADYRAQQQATSDGGGSDA